MKKIISMLLAVMMIATLSINVFAITEKDPDGKPGKITINGASTDNVYSLYKIFDVVTYDTTTGNYSYQVTPEWKDFFIKNENADLAEKLNGTGANYIEMDGEFVVKWIGNENDAERKETFAKLAMEYAEAKDLPALIASNDGTKNAGEHADLKDPEQNTEPYYEFTDVGLVFNNLPLGYYLIDSTMGALCGLTTTNPAASLNAKNAAPTIEKKVMEDSTTQWVDTNTADIGQVIEFRTTINVHAGAQNYVLHDAMDNGLTFIHDAPKDTPKYDENFEPGAYTPAEPEIFRGVWKIEHVVPGSGGTDSKTSIVPPECYDVRVGTALDSDCTYGCDFEVVFSQNFTDHLSTNDKIIIYYTAEVNENAVVGNKENNNAGNTNKTQLEFGDDHTSNEDSTTTKTFGVDLVKTDGQYFLLPGAKFLLYNAAEGGNVIPLAIDDGDVWTEGCGKEPLKDSEGNVIVFKGNKYTAIHSYRRLTTEEIAAGVQGVEIIVSEGKVHLAGFDNGDYWLEETEAPTSFNKLTARQKFNISDKSLEADITKNVDGKEVASANSGVVIVNKTGTMLPETGGMGTTLFICFGAVAVLGTGVLLVTKKRMGMIQD